MRCGVGDWKKEGTQHACPRGEGSVRLACQKEFAYSGEVRAAVFEEAARALDGRADLITADCAYTWFVREGLESVRAPAVTSSLGLLEVARAMGRDVAIVASSEQVLASQLGTPPYGVRIVGLDSKEEWARYQVYTVDTEPPLDRARMAKELLDRLDEDFAEHGEPDLIMLECTGLPQFRRVIRRRHAGPIIDIAGFVQYLLDVRPSEERYLPAAVGPHS